MEKIETAGAPKAIGPYSQAVAASGKMLFLSGQIGINPSTGRLVEGGIEAQTAQVLDNIEAVLGEAGLSLANVARVEVFMTNLDEFQAMNGVYAKRFEGTLSPARFTVEVSRLPAGARVEMAAIAVYHP